MKTIDPIPQKHILLAQKLWEFNQMHHTLEKADCILVLGSYDPRVVKRGVDLFIEGFAPYLVFSGGRSNLTSQWKDSEADTFAQIARNMGVPEEAIRIENKSTNSEENIVFSMDLLKKESIKSESLIIVHKKHMEKRAYATCMKHFPNKKIMVTSLQMKMLDYPNEHITLERVINALVGTTQRVLLYPEKGYQIKQEVPNEIIETMNELLAAGYDKHYVLGI